MQPLFKVYGHIYPADGSLEEALRDALSSAIQDPISMDIPLLERDKDLLRISFEGRYFPLKEVLDVLKSKLGPEQQGKLDFLDLEEWLMVRHLFAAGQITTKQASLNHVLDYSGF